MEFRPNPSRPYLPVIIYRSGGRKEGVRGFGLKLQLSSENGAFLYIYIGSSKEINFFQKIHSLNLRKEENLNSDIILFEDDSGLTTKNYPFLT